MLVVENGKLMFPPPAPPAPAVDTTKKETKVATAEVPIDYKAAYVRGAKNVGLTSATILALGAVAPDAAFSSMITTFCLSNIIGVQVVLGVTHALHSPLMYVCLVCSSP
jgi:hypothetical protein